MAVRGCNALNPDDYDSRTALDDFLGWEIEGPPDAYRGQFANGRDADFIAHARTDVPWLADYALALRARLLELGEKLEGE